VPTRDEIMAWIADESEAFANTLTEDALDNQVPSCPEWTLRDLTSHLGRVQRFWAEIITRGEDVEPEFPDPNEEPMNASALREKMRASTRALLDALRTTRWDAPAWTWWRDDRTVGAIARHQVQEAAVHRWDAQLASGTPTPLLRALADDGIDEMLWIARQFQEAPPVAFAATDSGNTYSASEQEARATVAATASDLVLLMYGRRSLDDVEVRGDRALLEAFLQPIG
jgi:uncharacterized protein (TIGR03083 family)